MFRIHLRKIKYKLQDISRKHRTKIKVLGPLSAFILVVGGTILLLNNFGQNNVRHDALEDNEFKLSLVSREDFLKKYQNLRLNTLPQGDTLSSSISGFIKNNTVDALLPARNWQVQFEDIEATSALAIYMPEKRILYGRNIFETRPIASLTKLMSALVIMDEFNLDDVITITNEAILEEGDSANLVAGEQFSVKELLYALLLESSNDAATAFKIQLEKNKPQTSFVALMNLRAKNMGLQNTLFVEPSGLSEKNVSSAYELSQIFYTAFENPILAQTMAESSYTTKSLNKDITHFWVNLNSLLGAYEGLLAGKTGFTNEAGPSMAGIVASPIKDTHVVSVVLDAQDRIEATRQLFDWVKKAYIWEE